MIQVVLHVKEPHLIVHLVQHQEVNIIYNLPVIPVLLVVHQAIFNKMIILVSNVLLEHMEMV